MRAIYPFSDLSLARRLETTEGLACARSVEARARVDPSSGACWIEVAGARAMFDGAASPVTQTFGLGIAGPVTAHDLETIEGFFREHGAPIFIAMMGALPGSGSQRNAERHGFRIAYTRVKWRLVC